MAAAVAGDNRFYGGWKIVEVELLTDPDEPGNISGLEGVEFHLSDTGDIFWKLPPGMTTTPYFAANFDLYEFTVESMSVGAKHHPVKFVGSQTGDKVEFHAVLKMLNILHLKYDEAFIFKCEKVWKIEGAIMDPFSLHSALAEGFFSDLTIKADSGKEFAVHKVILKATCPQLAWDLSPPPLSGSPEDVLSTVLHFLYTECMPETIQEETARKVQSVASKLPGFGRLGNLCQLYMHNVAVKNQIITYINEMHACGDRLAQIFSSRTTTTEGSVRVENFLAEPAKLVYAIKQAFRESAVAGVKFMMICDLFSKKKDEMSKHERHEVMKYVKSRLPVFVKQLTKFFEAFKEQLTKPITPQQKEDLSVYLVPEMDKCLDLSTELIEEGKNAIEAMLRVMKENEKKKLSTKDYLHRVVKNAMHMKELTKLRTAHERMTELFQSMMWRQEAFECLPDGDKAFSVGKNIEQLVEEFPQIIQKIEKLDTKVNDGFSMKNWKFVFKMGTSRVNWTLEKGIRHREHFKPIITRLNKVIHRDAFQSGLLQVGLLESVPMDEDEGNGASSLSSDGPGAASAAASASAITDKKPSIVVSLCTPPSACDSKLAKAMGELLASGVDADMCFEVVTVTEESSDIVVDHTQGRRVESQSSEKMETRHLMKAHCAVIAARCDWFRRALLSGMRESIDKKIEVHDTDPDLFNQFLVFLYSGQINTAEMSTDQITDMLSLGDRFEVDTLKHVCEAALKARLDEDSVLFLLSLADQFHATTLREATMNYIMVHPLVVKSDVYDELSESLKAEVKGLVDWNEKGGELDPVSRYRGMQHDSSDTSSEGVEMIKEEGTKERPLANNPDENMSSDEEDAAALVAREHQKMMDCVKLLKEIVGAEVPQEELEKLARAADYDVTRAVNHFYNS